MDIKDLRSRIDSIKNQNNSLNRESPEIIKTKQQPNPGEALESNGWEKIAEMVYKKVSVIKNILPETISEVLLDTSIDIPASNFVFYDTETTGLSAGAGNIVFLAGFGEILPNTADSSSDDSSDDFKITQIFLTDFPGEPAFLEYIKTYISTDRIYVSYNGKSFDANVLRSRYAMNGMSAEFGFQLDLLYPSRRLWKNIIGSCSLGDIERKVLDKHRALDVPGFMVPDLYFDFIRDGRWDSIEGVIAHHLEDISSLAELLLVHEQLISDAGACIEDTSYTPAAYFDHLGLASILADKRPEAATGVLSYAFEQGNYKAGIELSLQFKRSGQWENAVSVWNKLWIGGHSIFAGIELAKYYEHRLHDISAALKITSEMMSLEHFRIAHHQTELQKRRKRLEGKL